MATTRKGKASSSTRGRATGASKPASGGKTAKSRTRLAPAARKTTDKLATYRNMRDFARTPEPKGKVATRKRARQPRFVIQKHAASRLHYDFRLEIDGVLKSWAVPKGPSMDPADKRLAVETEDHPLDYADFEGVIPAHEYGGGTVIVWDAGTYRNLKRSGAGEVPLSECYERGQLEFRLDGKKLHGGFALIHSRMGGRARNWLLIKMKDEEAAAGRDVSRLEKSVLSGRTLDQVAARPGRVWSSR